MLKGNMLDRKILLKQLKLQNCSSSDVVQRIPASVGSGVAITGQTELCWLNLYSLMKSSQLDKRHKQSCRNERRKSKNLNQKSNSSGPR